MEQELEILGALDCGGFGDPWDTHQHSHRRSLSAFHAEGRPGNHRQPQAPGGL